MSHLIKIPFTEEVYEQLDEVFAGEDEDLNKFIFDIVKAKCKDAKTGIFNKKIAFNKYRADSPQPVPEFVKLKECKLENYELPFNPSWLPEEVEGENVKYWEHKLTDKTYHFLQEFAKMTMFRIEKFHASITEFNEHEIENLNAEMKEAKDNKEKRTIEDKLKLLKADFEEFKKNKEEAIPVCFEQVIYNEVYPQVQQRLFANMDAEFDKEFEEVYPEVVEKLAKKKDETSQEK